MRSIDDIYQEIILEKINMPTLSTKLLNEDGTSNLSTEQDLLNSLKTNSKVSIWKLYAYITAVVIWSHEKLWDLFKTEIEDIKASAFVSSLEWWVEKAKEWQFGYDLVIDPNNYSVKYDTIDESVQYIEHSAAIELDGTVILKIRRKDTDLLSIGELSSFESYVTKLKNAGTRVTIWNFSSDKLKLNYEVYYDPIVGLSNVKSDTEDAINDYISNIPFNSDLNITDLTDSIQLVNGIKGVRYINGEGRADYGSFTLIENYYSAIAGYCSIDSSFPLDSTITYIARY